MDTNRNMFIAPHQALGDLFEENGHKLYFVGGCVRDLLVGEKPKDIDFATSATPDEQIAIYEKAGLRWVVTGLDHGTITVMFKGEAYEITTFRIDRETDGRHATIEFTRDITLDCARRDLTINAMAMDFNGEIIDPFGGEVDLHNGMIKFVGDPAERIKEDYLRIMRFFRFYGRFGRGTPDDASFTAIINNRDGLANISVERIWVELTKILARTETGAQVLSLMDAAGVRFMPYYGYGPAARVTRDPVMILGFMLGGNAAGFCNLFKASSAERERAVFAGVARDGYTRAMAEADLLKRRPRDVVVAALAFNGLHEDAEEISKWEIPVFPVTGEDLLAIGFEQGPLVGAMLGEMRAAWVRSRYTKTRDELMLDFS